jgi:hypothetical protein
LFLQEKKGWRREKKLNEADGGDLGEEEGWSTNPTRDGEGRSRS